MLKTLLPAKLREALRLIRDISRGLPSRLLRDPGFELYCLYKGIRNYGYFKSVQSKAPEVAAGQIEPFKAAEIPKIIWMYWKQGEAEAPFVVQRCIASWRRHNPEWELRVLDEKTVSNYVDMDDFPFHLGLAARFDANLLRLRLMKTYGGVWADATVYCHRPLAHWATLMTMTGFFAFRHPSPGLHIESWLIIAEKGHEIAVKWERAYSWYLKGLTVQPWVYFVFAYALQWRVRRDAKLHQAWLRNPSLPAQPTFFMMEVLRGALPQARLAELVQAGLPVSKLTWNAQIDEAEFDALCARLEAL